MVIAMRTQRNTLEPRLQLDAIRLLDRVDIDPDDYPVELAELPTRFESFWRLAKAAARMAVHKVTPCPRCLRPVACLQLTEALVIVDAVEQPDGSDFWIANPFDNHSCDEVRQ
jgi:hypothetical protein